MVYDRQLRRDNDKRGPSLRGPYAELRTLFSVDWVFRVPVSGALVATIKTTLQLPS